jgi:hypothetical protein
MFGHKEIFYFPMTNSVVKKMEKNIRNNSYLADDCATFDNLLPNCDEAMVVLNL